VAGVDDPRLLPRIDENDIGSAIATGVAHLSTAKP
jgi:hypothetical protein